MPGTDETPTPTTTAAANGAGESAGIDTPTPLPIPTPTEAYERYEHVFRDVRAPFAFLDLDAVWSNAADMLRMAHGKPIRVASKSVRCRPVLERLLDLDRGFHGLLTFTLPETIWLWERGLRDLVLGYPTADGACLTRLARITAEHPDEAPVVMVDSIEHLDLIETSAASFVAPIRVAIDVDASWWPLGGLLKIGPKRSPVRTAQQAASLAREIERRERVRLVGLMAYEGQIAGVGDDIPGKAIKNAVTRAVQSASANDVRERRAEIVTAVSQVSELEFVNGGGTGSIEQTASEWAVTEVAAGSGFYAPVLFDHYRAFTLNPAAMFALPVVRKPAPGIATALGGGYLASGVGAKDRMPVPHLPAGLRLDPFEGTGEVQTPLVGSAADRLSLGDRVYFRHIKAGELCERFDSLYLVTGATIRDEVPTYRGEGRAFL
ncbi:MAG TPA: amino acid deaminase/aldolase [Solirubrobacterales bacterium]|jgi:D-serine deaminase-like pyridoxal phosphate-dependent protein|nr:amino acid deaminase/aldolase [Solirubrobacterales bacterium]